MKYKIFSSRKSGNGSRIVMYFKELFQAQEAGRKEGELGFTAELWMVTEQMMEQFFPSSITLNSTPVPSFISTPEVPLNCSKGHSFRDFKGEHDTCPTCGEGRK